MKIPSVAYDRFVLPAHCNAPDKATAGFKVDKTAAVGFQIYFSKDVDCFASKRD